MFRHLQPSTARIRAAQGEPAQARHQSHSRDLQRRDRSDLLPSEILRTVELVTALQVDPELRRGAEVLRESQRGICGDPPLAVHDLVDSARRHADRHGELVLRDPKPSMKSSMRTSPGWIGSILSVVVNDLHLLRPGVRPHETDPPLVFDPDVR